jgi:hypothetical protein
MALHQLAHPLSLSSYVDENRIGDSGCRSLAKGKWNHLTSIDLGILFFIQGRTNLMRTAASTSAKVDGRLWSASSYVLDVLDRQKLHQR